MNDIYFKPEGFGLEIIAELEHIGGYEFSKVVVWRRKSDGALLYGSDSGCSCHSPFESYTNTDGLTPVKDVTDPTFLSAVAGTYSSASAEDRANFIREVRDALRS